MDEASTDLLEAEVSAVLGREAGGRVASATWRPSDDGDAVIARARAGLVDPSEAPA